MFQVDWPAQCDVDGCEARPVVGWGPQCIYLCSAHFGEALAGVRYTIDRLKTLLTPSLSD